MTIRTTRKTAKLLLVEVDRREEVTDDYTTPIEEVAEDMLVNTEHHVGGRLGICDLKDAERAEAYLREKGWIGPKGGLTRVGLAEAKRAYREYWDGP